MGGAVGFLSGMFGVGGGVPPHAASHLLRHSAESRGRDDGEPSDGLVDVGRDRAMAAARGRFRDGGRHAGRRPRRQRLGVCLFGLFGHGQTEIVGLRRLCHPARHRRRIDAERKRATLRARAAGAHRRRFASAITTGSTACRSRSDFAVAALHQRHSAHRLGLLRGILSAILGVGGGFVIVPAMIYMLRMPTNVVMGTSLVQIVFVTAATTLLQAANNYTVDIVLAVMLVVAAHRRAIRRADGGALR